MSINRMKMDFKGKIQQLKKMQSAKWDDANASFRNSTLDSNRAMEEAQKK